MANHVDELLVSWMESRKKMQEMAKSRGFYPVFAIPPEVKQTFSQSNDKGKGKGSYGRKGGKGKGKPKGKGKGKGKGKKKGAERPPSFGQTASGSNTRHGPRFKRMRDGKEAEVNLVEEIEEINMVEDGEVDEHGTRWTYQTRDVPRPSSSSRKRRGEDQPEEEDELEEIVEEAVEEEPEETAGEEAEEEGEIDLNNPYDDFWKREGALVIRQHIIKRRALFTPEEAEGCPVEIKHLSDRRLTMMVYSDSHMFSRREECWKAESRANMVAKAQWVGESAFLIADEFRHLYPRAEKTEPEKMKEMVRTTPEDEDPSTVLWPIDGEFYKLVRLPGRKEKELREKIAEGEAAKRELRLLLAHEVNNDLDRYNDDALMVEEDLHNMEVEEVVLVEEGKVKGVADSGCTTTVCGKEVWKLFLKQRKEAGEHTPILYHRAVRKFKFGNGEISTATAQAGLEVYVLGKKQWIDVFLVPGSTPFLVSRKCLEDWGIEVSFSKKAMRYKVGEQEEPNVWIQVALSKKGHYLLDLFGEEKAGEAMEAAAMSSEDERAESEKEEESDDEEDEDEKERRERLEDIETTYVMTIYSEEADKGQEVAPRKRLDEIIESVWSVHESAKKCIADHKFNKKRKLIFEIFIDEGKLAKKWQHINEAWIEGYSEKLARMREESRRSFLQMTKDIYMVQWRAGRGCHVEQPHGALSWQTPELNRLPGHDADIYQCAFGAKAFDKEGNELGPCQKRTKIRSTSQRMAEALSRKCSCTTKHVQVRGEHAKKLQNYPDEMVEEMAKLMAVEKCELGEVCSCHAVSCHAVSVRDEKPDKLVDMMFCYMVEAVVHEDEPDEEANKEHLRELRRKFGITVVRNVLKLHRMLGHPPTRSLMRYLQQAKADGDWVECAKELTCSYCKERERPRTVRVARIPQADAFNELVQMDVFQVQHKGATRKILTIQDVFSKFTIDVPIKRETARTEWKALEDHWISWAGPPKELRVDSSGGHMSERFKASCEEKGVRLRIIPHGSHHQLGSLERDHQVRREQMALYQRAFPEDTLRTVLQFTSQQRNRMLNVCGYSPSTLVLGYTPKIPGGHDDFNLAEQARHADEFKVGERVFYWRRDPAASVSIKTHWRGPAVVCAIEPRVETEDGAENEAVFPGVYWLAHGSALLRCAAELMRPEYPEEVDEKAEKERGGQNLEDEDAGDDAGLGRVLRALRAGNAQGPVRYHDLTDEHLMKEALEDQETIMNHDLDVDWEALQKEMFRSYEESNRGAKRSNEELSPDTNAEGGGAASGSRGEREVRNFVDVAAEKTWFQEKWMILDGILGVHVDDFIGCGERISERKDLDRKIAMIAPRNFSERMVKLSQDFRFGSWDFVKEKGGFLFCGGEVNYDEEKNEIRMTHETYVHKVKPITIDKNRKKQEQEECTPKEVHQLRAGIGAVAWPSNQSSPHLTCSVSLMQATVAKAQVSDLCVFNKALSFAKNNADVGLRFNDICNGDVSKLRIGCYFDAAWAVRPDASSQGGYIVFAINEERIQDGKPTPLVILDWSSKKLPRKARSSLAAEVQAGSAGTDQLEWIKVFLTLIWHGEWSAVAEETARWLGKSPVITDAKSLYDAARSVTSGLGLAEKRTALEADAMLDRLKFMDAELKWTSAFQQVADGLTKPRARQCMAETLRRGTHALKYSEGCVAGKKMTTEQKKSIEDELQEKEEGAQDAKVKKKKAGKPSSWKTWGAPNVLKAITLAESFRTAEGSEVTKNFQVEVLKKNLAVDFDLRWRLMDMIVAILLILVVKKMCDWIWPVTKNSKDAEKKFIEQGTQTMNMDEERELRQNLLTSNVGHSRQTTGDGMRSGNASASQSRQNSKRLAQSAGGQSINSSRQSSKLLSNTVSRLNSGRSSLTGKDRLGRGNAGESQPPSRGSSKQTTGAAAPQKLSPRKVVDDEIQLLRQQLKEKEDVESAYKERINALIRELQEPELQKRHGPLRDLIGGVSTDGSLLPGQQTRRLTTFPTAGCISTSSSGVQGAIRSVREPLVRPTPPTGTSTAPLSPPVPMRPVLVSPSASYHTMPLPQSPKSWMRYTPRQVQAFV
eukprot:symbB.v1.2.013753.t1/scaffold976.1/size149240/6